MYYYCSILGKRSVSPTHSVDHLDPSSGQFMRPNSMKAWKLEQDKIREEEEKKRLEKEKKGRPRLVSVPRSQGNSRNVSSTNKHI